MQQIANLNLFLQLQFAVQLMLLGMEKQRRDLKRPTLLGMARLKREPTKLIQLGMESREEI